ncbi:MAG: hypothetical protein ACKO8Z_10430 [Prosthecobacter sp.]
MSRGNWRGAETDNAERRAALETSVWRERVNRRRPWLQRFRRRIAHLFPPLLLTLLYLVGAVHLALQHCRLTSLLCILAAAATVAVSRRHSILPSICR